jgi:hypothetical protein
MGRNASPEQLRRRLELRRSGAAGMHDPRPNRLRTRGAQEDSEIDDQLNDQLEDCDDDA